MPNKIPEFLSIDDICKLFKEKLNIKIQRSTVYFYIQNKGFPMNTGWGCPRHWETKKVLKWFDDQKA